jgi:uncharacterized protein (TIGR02145 family)
MHFLFILIITLFAINQCETTSTQSTKEQERVISYPEVEPSQAYSECKIGYQIWMAENLNEPHFKNGDPIKQANTAEEWKKAGNTRKPAWCYYNNDPKNKKKLGKLYNWYALNDPRGLAPKGWHLPNNSDWSIFFNTIQNLNRDAMALQHPEFIGDYPGSDVLKFHAYGSGYRKEGGAFSNINEYACYWCLDTANAYSANALYLKKDQFDLLWGSYYKSGGFSVRCIKN